LKLGLHIRARRAIKLMPDRISRLGITGTDKWQLH